MPRLPINYNNCIVYKLCCNDLNITDVYVGHTTDFIRRKQEHKHSCNNENSDRYQLKVYEFIREHSGFENWSMIEIEKFPCNDSREACKRERYWIENLRATLNSNVPSRTHKEYRKEYYETNSDTIKEKVKDYRANNSAKISEKVKDYYQSNIEKIKEYQKDYQNEYYQANSDKIKEYQKDYAIANSDTIKERKKEYYQSNSAKIKAKTNCECGGHYQHSDKSRHFKTDLHIAFCSKIN